MEENESGRENEIFPLSFKCLMIIMAASAIGSKSCSIFLLLLLLLLTNCAFLYNNMKLVENYGVMHVGESTNVDGGSGE